LSKIKLWPSGRSNNRCSGADVAPVRSEQTMYKSILVPLDGSATSERGLHEAIRLAHGHATRLVLLHVIDDFPTMRELATTQPFDAMRAQRRLAAEDLLASALELAKASHVKATTQVCFTVESTAHSIVDTAAETACELIVLGTHGRHGLPRAVMGSVAEAVTRLSTMPVMLVPPLAATDADTQRAAA
jgi:nucleotide-binding universal stress UspA family protein